MSKLLDPITRDFLIKVALAHPKPTVEIIEWTQGMIAKGDRYEEATEDQIEELDALLDASEEIYA